MEENRTDTPETSTPQAAESAFDTEALQTFGTNEGSGDSNLPVENAFFQGTEDTTEAASQTEQAPPVEETPSQDARNDERRYQYWQSQAAKRENELKALKAEVEETKSQVATQAPEQAAETVEEFPPPPHAPQKPARFSREEAWSDPSSESAKYLDEKEAWDGQIADYNQNISMI